MHGCSPDLETWSYVGENGDLVEGVEFTPRVLQHCRDKAGLKGSQMNSVSSSSVPPVVPLSSPADIEEESVGSE
jgi:hypothetical protein